MISKKNELVRIFELVKPLLIAIGSLFKKLRDAFTIKASGTFDEADYALRYLGSYRFTGVALLHYVFIGESKGCRPNAFYDPFFVRRHSGPNGLAEYLQDRQYWSLKTSPYFDGGWYRELYGSTFAATLNPLVHFLKEGFANGLDGSDVFKSVYFNTFPSCDMPDKRAAASDLLWGGHPLRPAQVPLSLDVLESRQRAFRDRIVLVKHAAIAAPRSNVLVMVQADATFDAAWLEENRAFDVLINLYANPYPYRLKADYVFQQPGTKTTAIATLLKQTEVLNRYEAVLFLDGDIGATAAGIDELFRERERHGLDLLQASLTASSECWFPTVKQPLAGTTTRKISGVEIMMPLVSARALHTCGWAFEETVSGWGSDLLLSKLVRERYGDTIGLVGSVVFKHERPTDVRDGAYYKTLLHRGIDAFSEKARIVRTYGTFDGIDAIRFVDLDPRPQILQNAAESLQ